MGFFSKGSDSSGTRRAPVRAAEAQANELRVRARRRLVGAVTLVVAAVIVVPMLIDNEPPPGEKITPIVVPALPVLPEQARIDLDADGPDGAITIEQLPDPEPPENVARSVEGGGGTAGGQAGAAPSSSSAPTASAPAPASAAPSPKPEPASNGRTDDGSVALALLEGRKPAAPAASAPARSGSFILQIAAYTTEQDASARRNKLIEAGVTNAFIESAVANGKTAWRLRVGPFPTREAAQAAQTRLRALGYDNGFISSK